MLTQEQRKIVDTVTKFAKRSLQEYKSTKEWTTLKQHSCETIRVPVALLKRIKDMEEIFKD